MGARVRLLGREISRRPARHYVGRIGATLISSSPRNGRVRHPMRCEALAGTTTCCATFSRDHSSRWIFDVEIIARFVQRWGRDAVASAVYELPVMRGTM